MSQQVLRFLQMKVTMEQAKDSPGSILTKYFQKVELVSAVSWFGNYPEYLLRLELYNEMDLENFSIDGIFEIVKVISNGSDSAIVIGRLLGPILLLIHQIEFYLIYLQKMF